MGLQATNELKVRNPLSLKSLAKVGGGGNNQTLGLTSLSKVATHRSQQKGTNPNEARATYP